MPYAKRPLKRNGRPRDDQKAPDGFTVNGWRQIHKGGYVRMHGTRHYHAKFAEWVGLWVFVEIDDGWALNVNAWSDEPWKDPRTLLPCTCEKDWFADKPALS